jgi:hypothetical protein
MKKESEEKSGYSVFVWVFVAVLLLYVLSIGPAAKIVGSNGSFLGSNGSAIATFGRIYAPVIWLHDHTPLSKPLDAYVSLWGLK